MKRSKISDFTENIMSRFNSAHWSSFSTMKAVESGNFKLAEDGGIRIAAKWKRSILSVVFSRVSIIFLLMLIQVVLMFGAWHYLEDMMGQFSVAFSAIAEGVIVVVMMNSEMDNSAKLCWMAIIAVVPVFGILMYAWTRLELGHKRLRDHMNRNRENAERMVAQNPYTADELKEADRDSWSLSRYIDNAQGMPAWNNTGVTYFPLGEKKFEAMLEELEKAEHFIFLEYFIVEEGEMWGRILKILTRKFFEGVEIRVMYDGTNELGKLPRDYKNRLEELGIRCTVWSPLMPTITTTYNYRDHRKILVIDGRVAFNGGVNLADEYINRVEVFGHWKDTAIMLKGDGVRSFTAMFLEMWDAATGDGDELSHYVNVPIPKDPEAQGFVIPYGDGPLDNHKTGEMVYFDILSTAEDYVHIMTPYLILDGKMEASLKFAAERGVDVKIIMPGIPDKKLVWGLAWGHFSTLIKAGVKIYLYDPGFVHAKVFVSDDRKAVVGTINLDYRSLYHHFECATYMSGVSCIADIEKDFNDTLAKCRMVTPELLKTEHRLLRFMGMVAKPLAPLL